MGKVINKYEKALGRLRGESILNENKLLLMQQNLSGKYRETYVSIGLYIHNSFIDDGLQNEVLNDILDLFLQAQESNGDIDLIIGADYKSFCDNVIAESLKKNSTHLKIVKFLKNILWFISYYISIKTLITIGLYFMGSDKTLIFNMNTLDLLILLCSIPCIYIVPFVVSKRAFKPRKILYIIVFSFLSLILLVAFIGAIAIFCSPSFDTPWLSIPFYIPLSASWIIYFLLNKYYKNQCIKGA